MATNGDKSILIIVLLINLQEMLITSSQSIVRFATNTDNLTVLETCIARSIILLFIATPQLMFSGKSRREGVTQELRWPLMLKILFGTACFWCQVASFKLLPLGIANVIILSAPFFVCIVAN